MKPGVEFYATAAQVIPVILLTLTLEERFREPPKGVTLRGLKRVELNNMERAWAKVLPTVALVLGETAAIAGTAGITNVIATRLVFFGLGMGGWALIRPLVEGWLDEMKNQDPPKNLSRWEKFSYPFDLMGTESIGQLATLVPLVAMIWAMLVV